MSDSAREVDGLRRLAEADDLDRSKNPRDVRVLPRERSMFDEFRDHSGRRMTDDEDRGVVTGRRAVMLVDRRVARLGEIRLVRDDDCRNLLRD